MKNKLKIVRVPATRKNAILLPDLHVPKQCAHSLYLAKRYGKEHEADVIVLTGDVMDSAAFGRHGHKPKDESNIEKHFEETITLLAVLRNDFPHALIYWTEGNHDLWFAQYIRGNARVLQNDTYFTMQKRLRLEEFGIQYLNEETALKFGDQFILHGHQFFRGKYQGDNPAKAVYNTMLENTIVGHVHKLSTWYKKKPTTQVTIKCNTTGCLSELAPSYNPTANYMNGFCHLRKTKDKTIVRNLIIEKDILF